MTQLGSFDIGDKPVFTFTITNTAGTATDPDTVICIWRVPAGTETSYTYGVDAAVTKSATGVYAFAAPTLAAAGAHDFRCKGTAGLIVAGEARIGVRQSAFTSP